VNKTVVTVNVLQGEMNAAELLKQMMLSINIPKPPTDITARLLLDRLTEKVVHCQNSCFLALMTKQPQSETVHQCDGQTEGHHATA